MIRQDAWNHDEDLLLAETVLRHIREGGTQLAAFDEVAEKLSRTPAACGFRWNSTVRKQYDSAIQLAKKARKEAKLHHVLNRNISHSVKDEEVITSQEKKRSLTGKEVTSRYDELITFLKEEREKVNQQGMDDDTLTDLREENAQLKKQLAEMRAEYLEIKEDYQLMIHAVQRAAKKENRSPAL
ncbi:RsfA family transcriptional regulator [Salipaludibacillus agaradhaerens]|uniref:RsfA family transcriptional regulator n=1 Tax=Salipaludibacillus agaradhaerens TaxID=76935 RepID=UPI0009971BF1|nr:RsfA family transcriptional regulator [Salipaludibacillus agaradhaerens]